MMDRGYVFLSNSTKPSFEENNSREKIILTNVSEPCLTSALEMNYNVYFGVNRKNPENIECELPINLYDSHTYRSLFNIKDNIIAYNNLDKIIKKNNINVIHCNTPIGGCIGRLCGRKNKVNKVIYTAHGFHFYKGAPLINNLLYKFAEKIMAHWTDVIITMNDEDFEAAKKFHLKNNGRVYLVHGVGISLDKFENPNNRMKKRTELGIKENDFMIISAGDLIARKNYATAIKAISLLKNKNIHYFICGKGNEEKKLKKLSKKYNVESQIHFLGYRKDVKDLLFAADLFLLTSKQEGLPRSLMEAMASGLPCVTSKIRGNVDVLDDNEGGLLYEYNDIIGFSKGINKLANDDKLCERMKKYNLEKIKQYDINIVRQEIKNIYKENINF